MHGDAVQCLDLTSFPGTEYFIGPHDHDYRALTKQQPCRIFRAKAASCRKCRLYKLSLKYQQDENSEVIKNHGFSGCQMQLPIIGHSDGRIGWESIDHLNRRELSLTLSAEDKTWSSAATAQHGNMLLTPIVV
jgi:hypothetical protein